MARATLSKKQQGEIVKALQPRFKKNLNRHKGIARTEVQISFEANPENLSSLSEMDRFSYITTAQNRTMPPEVSATS